VTPATPGPREGVGDFMVVQSRGMSSAAIAGALGPLGARVGTPIATMVGDASGIAVFRAGAVEIHEDVRRGGVGVLQLAAGPEGPPFHPRECLAELVGTRDGQRLEPARLRGSFCFATWRDDPPGVAAFVDPFRTRSLYYVASDRGFACATDLRWLVASGLVERQVDPHALYHYLNFGYVPTPFSIFKGARKVPPGSCVESKADGPRVTRYWEPKYPEDLEGGDQSRAEELHRQIVATVARYRPPGEAWGTFLSGGTDSSSIAGILAGLDRQAHVKSFSIGFEEAGYDELGYARIAAKHFGLASREHRVTAAEALNNVPRLAEAFDEPFGNASALPTYRCAALAAGEGVALILAGDGGDEIFGGNERYRKDRILDLFYRTPRVLRWPLEGAMGLLGGLDWRPINRVRNFVERGSVSNPERFYTDDAFASECFEELLSPEFRKQVDRGESLELLRQTFREAPATSELNRLLYLDLMRAIADCDLVKVFRASKLAGVAVSYPFLDPDLVAFTGRLPAADKVRGFEKRYLFKKAMAQVLPPEILAKQKKGFGLPVSVWLREHAGFRELVHDVVFSERARTRGYFNQNHVRHLLARHEKGAWDHSMEIYLLLMLELWHAAYVDASSLRP